MEHDETLVVLRAGRGFAVAPRRHVAAPSELSAEEHGALWRALERLGQGLRRPRVSWQPSAHFVFELEDAEPDEGSFGYRASDPGVLARDAEVRPSTEVLTTGGDAPLLPALQRALRRAQRVDIAVAFTLPSGWERLRLDLEDLLRRGGSLRILTGDYLGVTEPDALRRVLDLVRAHPEAAKAGLFEVSSRGFHPKTYLCLGGPEQGVAFVGSSNLTAAALGGQRDASIEWNQGLLASRHAPAVERVERALERLWDEPEVVELSDAVIEAYVARRPEREKTPEHPVELSPEPAEPTPTPHPVQREALDQLLLTRAEGRHAAMVILATGLGKTWLAAFDAQSFERVLFVAHREEILEQALRTFRRIRPAARLGFVKGAQRDLEAEVIFASVQTLAQPELLRSIPPDRFDYIVVDEFHHAAAASYRRVLEHFDPVFLLGLTATPDRTDGASVASLCGDNEVFRCSLLDGIQRRLLCPFTYLGLPDDVDYEAVGWRGRSLDALSVHLETVERAERALDALRTHGGRRTLGFCCSQSHADFMARQARGRGLRAASVHTGPGAAPRAEAIEQLAAGALDVIFSVDVFNEGVDIPSVDTILMLRPTESRVVWLQQLGRGLRLHADKTRLTVIDFIGNHRRALIPLGELLGVQEGVGFTLPLQRLRAGGGKLDLGGDCELDIELSALSILEALARPPAMARAFAEWVAAFIESHGRRPSASEAMMAGYAPNQLPKALQPWFGALAQLQALSEVEASAWARPSVQAFVTGVEEAAGRASLVSLALLRAVLSSGRAEVEVSQVGRWLERAAYRDGVLAWCLGSAPTSSGELRARVEQAIEGFDGAELEADTVRLAGVGGVGYAMAEELLEASWQKQRRAEKRAHVRPVWQSGAPINATFSLEASEGRFELYLESRGSDDRNTEYARGLRLLLQRAQAWRARLEGAALASTRSNAELRPKGCAFPLELEGVDVEVLRRALQRAQGNNPTRRIRLRLSGGAFDEASLGAALHWLEFGRPLPEA